MNSNNQMPKMEETEQFRKKQGRVYMFLQGKFKDYSPRSEEDIKADVSTITACFKDLGFDVKEPVIDGTMEVITKHLVEAKNLKDWSEYESMLVFFVTLSPAAGELLCKDCTFNEEDMISIMKGPPHTNLLKLFVFQASQAKSNMVPSTDNGGNSETRLPIEANFFVIKSSFEREATQSENGSYFLKIFCQILKEFGNKTSLFDVMTAVLRELKAIRTDKTEHPRNNFLPEVTSTMLKPAFFGWEGKTSLNAIGYEVIESIGKLIVFNYTYTSTKSVYAVSLLRPGAEYDVPEIQKSFGNIGFKVEVNNDLTADEVRKTLSKGTRCKEPNCQPKCPLRHKGGTPADYSKDTCIAVAIMTHGHSNFIETTDEEIHITHIIKRLSMKDNNNNEKKYLCGKPKLFFLQVCRSSKQSPNLQLDIDNVLIFHSTYHGNVSNREAESGTWFIQHLCKKIDKIPDDTYISLTDFLQEVQQSIVNEYGDKQMPVIYSTLTKNLFIGKGGILKPSIEE